ncbi:hypothetical protein [Streptomyces sp. NPDC029721]|uniref:hypothetical protein n=1 Tax=unclassified Streptomyces TaxID=2593676 RepID=UPI003405B05B
MDAAWVGRRVDGSCLCREIRPDDYYTSWSSWSSWATELDGVSDTSMGCRPA